MDRAPDDTAAVLFHTWRGMVDTIDTLGERGANLDRTVPARPGLRDRTRRGPAGPATDDPEDVRTDHFDAALAEREFIQSLPAVVARERAVRPDGNRPLEVSRYR